MDLQLSWSVSLPVDDAAELWTLQVRNVGSATRALSLYPFFTIGYMSWMNQSATYRPDLGGVVARSITPYQKVEDYERIKGFKDLTCLLHAASPTAWEARLEAFEGEGGLASPDALRLERLGAGDAVYEMPAAVLQYRVSLAPGAVVVRVGEMAASPPDLPRDVTEVSGPGGPSAGEPSAAAPVATRQESGIAQESVIALVGGTVHPVSGPAVQDGVVVIQGGTISAVGRPVITGAASAGSKRTVTSPNSPTMTFNGFRSRCTTSRAWA